MEEGVYTFKVHPDASKPQIRDAVQSWLQRQARRVFEERCREFAARLSVRMTRLSLSSAATRWGSASAGWARLGCYRHGRGVGDAPFGFKLFHQVSDFDDRGVAKCFYQCCFI